MLSIETHFISTQFYHSISLFNFQKYPFSDPCVYVNLEFKGGDLSVIPSLGFAACKRECQKLRGCSFFTINNIACILKDSNVEIHRKSGVISGATDDTCSELWTV